MNFLLRKDGWSRVRFIASGTFEKVLCLGRISCCIIIADTLSDLNNFWNQKDYANDILVLELMAGETVTRRYWKIKYFTKPQSPEIVWHLKAGYSTVCCFVKYTIDDAVDWLGKEGVI